MTSLVGILNITPDSFSDGGIHNSEPGWDSFFQEAKRCNISVIDIGAESTRPEATPLTPQEEWSRLEPFFDYLIDRHHRFTISLDTRHAETAERACKTGLVSWINDVSGLQDSDMCEVLAAYEVHYVLMHSLTVPADPKTVMSNDQDVIREIRNWCVKKIAALVKAGVPHQNLLFDPGIGFGKTGEQSLVILKQIHQFKQLGLPLLVGHSRKSFFNFFSERPASERDLETVLASYWLATHRVDYLRVHNLDYHARLLSLHHYLHNA